MLGLTAHRLLPVEAEPGEIVIDCLLKFRAAAFEIDVFDPEQELAAGGKRHFLIEQCRKAVAEMQIAIRRRREAKDARNIGSCHHWDSSLRPLAGLRPGAHRL